MHYRIKDIYAFFAAMALLAVLFMSPDTRADGLSAETPGQGGNAWRFRVLLDEKEIGFHDFFLAGEGEHRQLRSVARFEYRLLFVKLFDYEHENLETWSGNCLQSIRSRTDSNGDLYTVSGRRSDEAFNVVSDKGAAALPDCVMTFAYWNPDFLEQSRLLNTQDGSFLDVDVSAPVSEELVVNGEPLTTYRYRLVAGEMKLDLWYSAEKEWLALESEVAGGRTLRYEPVRRDVS